MSVLTFVVKRQAELLCEQVSIIHLSSASMNNFNRLSLSFQVKTNCTEDQMCARVSCNVTSIAQSCLHLAPRYDIIMPLPKWITDFQQHS